MAPEVGNLETWDGTSGLDLIGSEAPGRPTAGFQIYLIAVVEEWMPNRQESTDTVEKLDKLHGKISR